MKTFSQYIASQCEIVSEDEAYEFLHNMCMSDYEIHNNNVPAHVIEDCAFVWLDGVGVFVPGFGEHSAVLMLLLELSDEFTGTPKSYDELIDLGDRASDRVCYGNDEGLELLPIAYRPSVASNKVYISRSFNKIVANRLRRLYPVALEL